MGQFLSKDGSSILPPQKSIPNEEVEGNKPRGTVRKRKCAQSNRKASKSLRNAAIITETPKNVHDDGTYENFGGDESPPNTPEGSEMKKNEPEYESLPSSLSKTESESGTGKKKKGGGTKRCSNEKKTKRKRTVRETRETEGVRTAKPIEN